MTLFIIKSIGMCVFLALSNAYLCAAFRDTTYPIVHEPPLYCRTPRAKNSPATPLQLFNQSMSQLYGNIFMAFLRFATKLAGFGICTSSSRTVINFQLFIDINFCHYFTVTCNIRISAFRVKQIYRVLISFSSCIVRQDARK